MEQTQPKSGNRTLLYAIIGGAVVLIALIAIGVVVFANQAVQQRQSSIPELLDPTTAIYGTITPALSDLPGAARLQSAYPQLFVEDDSAEADAQLQEELGVTYADIQPWLGTEIAIALSDFGDLSSLNENGDLPDSGLDTLPQNATSIAVLASTSADDAQAFLDKQRAHRSNQGEEFSETTHQNVAIYESNTVDEDMPFLTAFALVGDHVVFASNAEVIPPMIDRQVSGGDSLASNSRFVALRDEMPESIGYIYLDGVAFGEVLLSNMDEALRDLPPEQASNLDLQMQNIRALQSIGLSMALVSEGIEFDATTIIDLQQLDETLTSQLDAIREPVDEARLQTISDDALALMTFKIPTTFKDQVLDAIEAQPDAQQSLTEFEQQLNMDLETDLLDWFAGDGSLVVLPTEELGDVTFPSLYFAINPQERDAAEAGMTKIQDALTLISFGLALFDEQEIGGTTWGVLQEAQTNQTLGGYGFVGDDLVIAVGTQAMEFASTGSEQPITSDADFTTVTSNLYTPNGGIVYIDVDGLTSALDEAGASNTIEPETRDILDPINSIGIAGEPGIDENGVGRAKVFVYIQEE